MSIFQKTDILLPNTADMNLWSVVACDQFTSEPEYWARVEASVGEAPSALRLMLPEAYLARPDREERELRIAAAMRDYLNNETFRTRQNAFIYLERIQSDGRIRQGLVGAVDLEHYEYLPQSTSAVRATEATVIDRLPPRVAVRRRALLEMPHIMLLMDDPGNTVLAPLAEKTDSLCKEYDFTLMEGGGTLRGYAVSGTPAEETEARIAGLARENNGDEAFGRPVLAVGDGNHSLAAAKLYWEEIKQDLSIEQRENHPARFALAELVNIHSPALDFEPIHRILNHTDPSEFFAFLEKSARTASKNGAEQSLTLLADGARREITVRGLTAGEIIRVVEDSCLAYLDAHGGEIDYIHDDDTLLRLASRPGTAAVLLPSIQKADLFESVARSGAFPRKSFSMGHARDKRYYLECRRIRT